MNKKLKCLCPSPSLFSKYGISLASELFELTSKEVTYKEMQECDEKFDVLLVRFDKKINEEIANKLGIKYIICPATGINHFSKKLLDNSHIKIFNLRNQYQFLENITATAEHTINLILCSLRNNKSMILNERSEVFLENKVRGNEIKDSKIGLIGLGRIGNRVAEICHFLGANIYYYDPNISSTNKNFTKVNDILEFTKDFDIISIHANFDYNKPIILDQSFFMKIKKLPLFVNTSRSELIDLNALLRAFDANKIEKIAIDVLPNESEEKNSISSLLRNYVGNNNFIVTPHIGGYTYESVEMTDGYVLNKFKEYYDENYS